MIYLDKDLIIRFSNLLQLVSNSNLLSTIMICLVLASIFKTNLKLRLFHSHQTNTIMVEISSLGLKMIINLVKIIRMISLEEILEILVIQVSASLLIWTKAIIKPNNSICLGKALYLFKTNNNSNNSSSSSLMTYLTFEEKEI